jgi:hypothetical protein
VGLNGTVVDSPHSEHVVRVSERTREVPVLRFALHCLQRFGSFMNCLSWKKSCSPAVNTNSAPQSTHVRTLSVNCMAGFPKAGKLAEIGQGTSLCRSVSLSFRVAMNIEGPGREKKQRQCLSSQTAEAIRPCCTTPRAEASVGKEA